MRTLEQVLQAINALAPLIEELAAYFAGGPEPAFIEALPAQLKSRVALEARKARAL